jgi:hypothetical protein
VFGLQIRCERGPALRGWRGLNKRRDRAEPRYTYKRPVEINRNFGSRSCDAFALLWHDKRGLELPAAPVLA